MKFIEFHEKETNTKVLMPLDKILSISQSHKDLTAFIEIAVDCDGVGIGFETKELYAEIVIALRKIA